MSGLCLLFHCLTNVQFNNIEHIHICSKQHCILPAECFVIPSYQRISTREEELLGTLGSGKGSRVEERGGQEKGEQGQGIEIAQKIY